jgi:hypothetical protein
VVSADLADFHDTATHMRQFEDVKTHLDGEDK